MRKFLLLFTFAFVLGIQFSQAQCTPSPLFVTIGIPGIYPNPIQQSNLTAGSVGNAYSETITIITLADTTIDLSAIVGIPLPPVTASVEYQRVNSVNGLPNGLTYACNPSSCEVPGDSSGCVGISGTPTQGGSFTVSLDTEIGLAIPASIPYIGGTIVDVPIPGVSWTLDISGGVASDDLLDDAFTVEQNGPNPFHGITNIFFNTPKPVNIDFRVKDLSGRTLHTASHRGHVGENSIEFDASNYVPGVYFYELSNGNQTIIQKMIVQ